MVIKQRRRPRQARAIKKYNEILDASAHILQDFEYAKVTMQEISLESGHPYATIYQYFANKEAVYAAWLERFIETSLYGFYTPLIPGTGEEVQQNVDGAVKVALEQTIQHQPTLSALFANLPLSTARVVELMESCTLRWLKEVYGVTIDPDADSRKSQRLLTTIRAGNGYWLQLILNTERAIDVEQESKNYSALVNALLLGAWRPG